MPALGNYLIARTKEWTLDKFDYQTASLSFVFDLQPEMSFSFISQFPFVKRYFSMENKKKSQDLFLDLIVWLVFFFFKISVFAPKRPRPARAQEIDTNSIELKSKRKENERKEEEKYLKSKLLVNPSLGKYSIKILSKWTFFIRKFLWIFHSISFERSSCYDV